MVMWLSKLQEMVKDGEVWLHSMGSQRIRRDGVTEQQQPADVKIKCLFLGSQDSEQLRVVCAVLGCSVVSDSVTPWTVAHQVSLFMGMLQARILE